MTTTPSTTTTRTLNIPKQGIKAVLRIKWKGLLTSYGFKGETFPVVLRELRSCGLNLSTGVDVINKFQSSIAMLAEKSTLMG